jgi:hypothetical protein
MAPRCRASVAGRRARPDASPNAICGAFLSSVSTQRGSPTIPSPPPRSSLQDAGRFVCPVGYAALYRRQQARLASRLGDCQAFTVWHVTVIQRIDRSSCADARRLAMRFVRRVGVPGVVGEPVRCVGEAIEPSTAIAAAVPAMPVSPRPARRPEPTDGKANNCIRPESSRRSPLRSRSGSALHHAGGQDK